MEECADVAWYLAGFQRRYPSIDWEDVETLENPDFNAALEVCFQLLKY